MRHADLQAKRRDGAEVTTVAWARFIGGRRSGKRYRPNGAREIARRRAQVKSGSLRVNNGFRGWWPMAHWHHPLLGNKGTLKACAGGRI